MARLVVRAPFDGSSRDAIDDALAALGLQLTNIVAPTESEPGQWVYATRTADALVHLVEEGRLGLRYFALAPGQDALLVALAAAVPCFEPPALRAELAATADEVRRVELLLVLCLAVEAGPAPADLAAAAALFASERLDVRAAALAAAGCAGWPELAPAFRERAASEPDARLRAHAAALAALSAAPR